MQQHGNDKDQYVAPIRIRRLYDITACTLSKWGEEGRIRFLRPGNGRRIYHLGAVHAVLGIAPVEDGVASTLASALTAGLHGTVCYARVSSSHQKADLDRQCNLLQSKYPDSDLLKDVGSGLNWNRPGLRALLDRVHAGTVRRVVVTYKDRLCRFGMELVAWILEKSGVELVVLGANTSADDPAQELAEDLLAITTVFVARNNGRRAGYLRRQRADAGLQGDSRPDPPLQAAEEAPPAVVRRLPVGLQQMR